MKTLILSALIAAGLATASAPALAQNLNQREANQQQRINQGVRSGELTPREAARDERGLARVEGQVARERAMNGGHLTRRERMRAERRLNHESRRIYRTKHNHRRW